MEKNDKRGAVEEFESKITTMNKLSSMMASVNRLVEEWKEDENKGTATKETADYYKNMLHSLNIFSNNLNELIRDYKYRLNYMRSMTAIYAPPDVFKAKKTR